MEPDVDRELLEEHTSLSSDNPDNSDDNYSEVIPLRGLITENEMRYCCDVTTEDEMVGILIANTYVIDVNQWQLQGEIRGIMPPLKFVWPLCPPKNFDQKPLH